MCQTACLLLIPYDRENSSASACTQEACAVTARTAVALTMAVLPFVGDTPRRLEMGLSASRKDVLDNGASTSEVAVAHGNVFIISSRQDWNQKISEATSKGKIVVVDFSAEWCGPCRTIAPFYAALSEKYPQLIFLKVDVDQMNELSKEMGVKAMPTFLFMKDGKQIDKLIGADKAQLEKKVLSFAANAQQ